MIRHFRGFLAMLTAVLALPVVTIAILFLLQVSGEISALLEPMVDPIAGVGPGAIIDGAGNAWTMLAVAAPLSIVAAVALFLFMGGGGSGGGRGPRREQSGSDDRDSMPPY